MILMASAFQPLSVDELRNALAIHAGSEDHQPGRVPELDLIMELCGSLVRLEPSQTGNDGDRLVKFVHKSVLDFFKSDPDTLAVRNDLRCFFVDQNRGNLETGRNCLAYLRYNRYQTRIDVTETLNDGEEHAFLKYAAAYWFEHLENIPHSEELFQEVRTFVQSPAFWTCLAVQTKVRPHLFCRYTEIRGGGGYQIGLNRGELTEDDSIAVPLPNWLDEYKPGGHELVKAVYNHLKEWHEVMVSYPEAGDQCMMDQVTRATFPGMTAWQSKRVRLSTIKGPAGVQRTPDLSLADVSLSKGKIYTRILYQDAADRECTLRWQEASLSSSQSLREGTLKGNVFERTPTSAVIRLDKGSQDSAPTANQTGWIIHLKDLSVTRLGGDEPRFTRPTHSKIDDKSQIPGADWSLVSETSCATQYGSAYAFHVTNTKLEEIMNKETDSGYESDWSGSGDGGGDEDSKAIEETDCLIVCCEGEKPSWFTWGESGSRSLISCAFHPSRSIAAWSRSLDELQIFDLTTGRTVSKVLPEPAGARASKAVIYRGKNEPSVNSHPTKYTD
jgi:hypothetical protein